MRHNLLYNMLDTTSIQLVLCIISNYSDIGMLIYKVFSGFLELTSTEQFWWAFLLKDTTGTLLGSNLCLTDNQPIKWVCNFLHIDVRVSIKRFLAPCSLSFSGSWARCINDRMSDFSISLVVRYSYTISLPLHKKS